MKTYNELMQMPENTVLCNVVFKEHTIGYLHKWLGGLVIGIWSSKITKGGMSWKNGNVFLAADIFHEVREATPQDFESFRVSPKGHI